MVLAVLAPLTPTGQAERPSPGSCSHPRNRPRRQARARRSCHAAPIAETLTATARPGLGCPHDPARNSGPPPARGGPRTQTRPPDDGTSRNGQAKADTATPQKKDPIRSASREGVRGGCSGAWQRRAPSARALLRMPLLRIMGRRRGALLRRALPAPHPGSDPGAARLALVRLRSRGDGLPSGLRGSHRVRGLRLSRVPGHLRWVRLAPRALRVRSSADEMLP